MNYRVLPDFMRQREQRVAGLLTIPQMMVGLCGLLVLVVVAKISVCLIPFAMLGLGLAMYAASPLEGELRFLQWVAPLRLLIAREKLTDFTAFPTVGRMVVEDTVPLVVRRGDDIVLAVDVSFTDLKS